MKWGGTRIKHVSGSENIYNGMSLRGQSAALYSKGFLSAAGDALLIARQNSLSKSRLRCGFLIHLERSNSSGKSTYAAYILYDNTFFVLLSGLITPLALQFSYGTFKRGPAI
ncbi:hypothetical protein Zmor_000813 [Zophobas morio]|uniref:Uncharacterized protein n=1 Tax=Zophobas morio TaxID=2755281 RepID=A0AA38J0T9_9CUCU|nr:hypothetical protein Zmor_000813 [Zophobas morio]